MQARLVLRLMPEMKYGPTYSKGVRLAFSSGKWNVRFKQIIYKGSPVVVTTYRIIKISGANLVFLSIQTGKYQSGIEIEANKLDLPDSVLPRNLNARLQLNVLGYRLKALEVNYNSSNVGD